MVLLHSIWSFLAAFQDINSAFFGLKSVFLALFWKVTIFIRHSILMICHFGHFSFSTLFLNIAWYTLLAISGTNIFTPINVRFLRFLFLIKNKNQHSGCWKRHRQRVFFTFSRASLVLPILAVFRGKNEIFRVPNLGKKCQKHVFSH